MKTTHTRSSDSTTASLFAPMTENGTRAASNDNATRGGSPDTTHLVARPDVVRYLRAILRRFGVALQNMEDAIADVQTDSIEAARVGCMPAGPAEWKAFAGAIAVNWAIDRLRETEVRSKYDAGLCDDADVYARPTLYWEHRDPVDTRRYLAVLKALFDSEQMPEHGAEILWGEADKVPHKEIAAEIGVSKSVVRNRLFRMRARFQARLAASGWSPSFYCSWLHSWRLGVKLAHQLRGRWPRHRRPSAKCQRGMRVRRLFGKFVLSRQTELHPSRLSR